MIVDIISDVVDKVKVFDIVNIITIYNVGTPFNNFTVILNTSYGDIHAEFTPPITIILNGGSCDGEIVTADTVHYVPGTGVVFGLPAGAPSTCTDYTTVSIVTGKVTDGVGIVTLDPSDIQYWYEGARMKFKDGGTYYYGTVTDVTSPTVTVLLDNLDDLSSITEFAMVVNYIHGHPIDVFNQLSEMAQNPDYKLRGFPMIALMQDFEEDGSGGYDKVATVDIIIAVDTKPEYTASERYTASFDDVLAPLYKRFVYFLEQSSEVYWRKRDHVKIDRLYWGKTGALGNEENKASSFIDAIELNIKELNILQTC
jgi:hypothetical protein